MELQDKPAGYAIVKTGTKELVARLYVRHGNAKAARRGMVCPTPYMSGHTYAQRQADRALRAELLYDILPVYFAKDNA